MSNPLEVVERQNAIIRIQSHISAEEADTLPAIQKINEAAALRNEMEKKGG